MMEFCTAWGCVVQQRLFMLKISRDSLSRMQVAFDARCDWPACLVTCISRIENVLYHDGGIFTCLRWWWQSCRWLLAEHQRMRKNPCYYARIVILNAMRPI